MYNTCGWIVILERSIDICICGIIHGNVSAGGYVVSNIDFYINVLLYMGDCIEKLDNTFIYPTHPNSKRI